MVQKDKGGITCDGIESTGRCPDGKIPYLHPANYQIWYLFQQMFRGLVWDGGYDYGAIEVIFNGNAVNQDARPMMISQIIRLVEVLEVERQKRRKR